MLDCNRHRSDLTIVGRIMRGLNAVYVKAWGDTALVVQNAKPIPRRVLLAMASLLRAGGVPKWSANQHLMWLALHLYECSTGERKNALGLSAPGDTFLRRLDLVWVGADGNELAMTPGTIRSLTNGATLRGSAAAGKTDRFRIVWGNRYQWFILDDTDPLNFANAWKQFELQCPCPPAERAKWAAFGKDGGSSAWTVHTLDTHFHKVLDAAVSVAETVGRTFHDYRATLASALCTARANGVDGIDNALIQALCHWKTDESVQRYSHMRPAEYGKFVRIGTDTDAGTSIHKDAPIYDPFSVCAELTDIAEKLAVGGKGKKKVCANLHKEADAGASASVDSRTFTLFHSEETVTCVGRDSWGLLGSSINVLNTTWADGAGTSLCEVSAFLGVYEHSDGTRAESYVITDADGDHYAVAARTLRVSLSKAAAGKCRGAPKPA